MINNKKKYVPEQSYYQNNKNKILIIGKYIEDTIHFRIILMFLYLILGISTRTKTNLKSTYLIF